MVQGSRFWPKAKNNFLMIQKVALEGSKLPVISGVQTEADGDVREEALVPS